LSSDTARVVTSRNADRTNRERDWALEKNKGK
jgi:hypothetical protein